jgi:hypothetical protein
MQAKVADSTQALSNEYLVAAATSRVAVWPQVRTWIGRTQRSDDSLIGDGSHFCSANTGS